MIFKSPSDNFDVKFCLILLIISFTLGKYGDWMHYWFFYCQGNVCMKRKIGKFIKMIFFKSFCGWFGEENAKQEFFSLLRHFSQKKGFLRKNSRLVEVR